jgi:glucose-1-phosphate cytidylyltransferase
VKTVLFCGGQGMRIREFSEAIPKPMIPIGGRPILWHLMRYYAQYGHKDFVLCLGYRASVVKDFFTSDRPQVFEECAISSFRRKSATALDSHDDWRVALADTGIDCNIGERLVAVKEHVKDEEMFFANYADGLCDVNLTRMIETFRRSNKVACFLAVRPTFSMHLIAFGESGRVSGFRLPSEVDLWINGGFFIMRPEIFDYIRDGEELVSEPFSRLIAEDKLLAYRHEGFWCPMDTLKDRQRLEQLIDGGSMPWIKPSLASRATADATP